MCIQLNLETYTGIKQTLIQNPKADLNKLEDLKKIPDKKCIRNTEEQYKIEIDGQIYPKKISIYDNKSIDFNCLNETNKSKLILFWNNYFNVDMKKLNCPIKNCVFTYDKSYLKRADLVVAIISSLELKLPTYQRPAYQRWVLANYESPIHTIDFSIYDGYFNLSSTYLENSDYPRFYDASIGLKFIIFIIILK